MAVIEVRRVTKTYRRGGLFGRRKQILAVADVSLAIPRGSCLALVGPSGSGKSTLGRLLLGLEKPDMGEVLYEGKSFQSLRGKEKLAARRNVQAVFQNFQAAVNPRFTARDIIAEPLVNFEQLSGRALTARIEELLTVVGLGASDMSKRPHQFSGGELQRICLARALAPRPEVLVLDEAVSSLDMINQIRVMEIISHIRREYGTAFLFITHDMRIVANCADSMAIMDNGSLVLRVDEVDAIASCVEVTTSPLYSELIQAILPSLQVSGRP